MKLHSSRLLSFSVIKPVVQRKTQHLGIQCSYCCQSIDNKLYQSAWKIYTSDWHDQPSSCFSSSFRHRHTNSCSNQQAYPGYIYKGELCQALVSHIQCWEYLLKVSRTLWQTYLSLKLFIILGVWRADRCLCFFIWNDTYAFCTKGIGLACMDTSGRSGPRCFCEMPCLHPRHTSGYLIDLSASQMTL